MLYWLSDSKYALFFHLTEVYPMKKTLFVFGPIFVAYGLYGISNAWIHTAPTLYLKGGVLIALGIALMAWGWRR